MTAVGEPAPGEASRPGDAGSCVLGDPVVATRDPVETADSSCTPGDSGGVSRAGDPVTVAGETTAGEAEAPGDESCCTAGDCVVATGDPVARSLSTWSPGDKGGVCTAGELVTVADDPVTVAGEPVTGEEATGDTDPAAPGDAGCCTAGDVVVATGDPVASAGNPVTAAGEAEAPGDASCCTSGDWTATGDPRARSRSTCRPGGNGDNCVPGELTPKGLAGFAGLDPAVGDANRLAGLAPPAAEDAVTGFAGLDPAIGDPDAGFGDV